MEKDIRRLCRDFGHSDEYKDVVAKTLEYTDGKETPSFYKGKRDNFLYDVALRYVRPIINA